MKMTRNAIYTYVADAVNTEERPVYCSSRYEPVPEYFPALYLAETSRRDVQRYVTLKFDEDVHEVTWEAQVFSNSANDAVNETHTIMDDVYAAFREMNFMQTFCAEIPDTDPSIYRMVARFERIIGGANTIPEKGD